VAQSVDVGIAPHSKSGALLVLLEAAYNPGKVQVNLSIDRKALVCLKTPNGRFSVGPETIIVVLKAESLVQAPYIFTLIVEFQVSGVPIRGKTLVSGRTKPFSYFSVDFPPRFNLLRFGQASHRFHDGPVVRSEFSKT
jgi:hypothetical protein